MMSSALLTAWVFQVILLLPTLLLHAAGSEPPAPGFSRASENKGEPAATPPSKTFRDPLTGMDFVLVKGGCYPMGDLFGEGIEDEEPVHEVCLGDFYIGRYEVTQEQWQKVMDVNPSFFNKGGKYPVENIRWYDIQEFIEKLKRTAGVAYRLPTEAEWEYAARSGGRKERWAGTSKDPELDEFAWTDRNSHEQSHPVGQKKPNGLGLFDLSGNLWEWLADWYDPDYYKYSPRNNPRGPESSWDRSRVIRGGSWISSPEHVRASQRARAIPSVKGNVGFRLAFTP
jgi:formylglycine-generating enzyme required for sulfatase activity